jgi:hypothetical protein
MQSEPSWTETGLDIEKMYKPEAAQFWLQYSSTLFIEAIVHEIRSRVVGMGNEVRFLQKQAEITSNQTLKEACESALIHEAVLQDMLDTARRFAKQRREQNPSE